MLPRGSRTRPPRSPQTRLVISVTETAPAARACWYTASASSTYRRRKQGVSGHPSLVSKAPTMESPILASACVIVPSWFCRRESSCAPNACCRNSRSVAVSREIIHGITVELPSGIGGTAFGCGSIFMLLVLRYRYLHSLLKEGQNPASFSGRWDQFVAHARLPTPDLRIIWRGVMMSSLLAIMVRQLAELLAEPLCSLAHRVDQRHTRCRRCRRSDQSQRRPAGTGATL